MAKIKVLVVEDESIVSKDIQFSLKRLGYEIAGAAATGERAIELADEQTPDIVLMDIMLKGSMNGIQTADIIRKKHNLPIIFLTAYADESTIENAKITEPHGYILKPFKEIDLHTTIEIALYKHKQELAIIKERDLLYSLVETKDSSVNEYLFVKSNSQLVKIETNNIFYIEALKDYVVINTLDKRFTIHSTMKGIEEKLSPKDFMRIHRSFIIRIDKIASIEFPNLQLENDKKLIPIGGSYKDELFQRLNLL